MYQLLLNPFTVPWLFNQLHCLLHVDVLRHEKHSGQSREVEVRTASILNIRYELCRKVKKQLFL